MGTKPSFLSKVSFIIHLEETGRVQHTPSIDQGHWTLIARLIYPYGVWSKEASFIRESREHSFRGT